MAAYCQNHFYKHLTEDSIKRNILDAATLPANPFCTHPKIDDFCGVYLKKFLML